VSDPVLCSQCKCLVAAGFFYTPLTHCFAAPSRAQDDELVDVADMPSESGEMRAVELFELAADQQQRGEPKKVVQKLLEVAKDKFAAEHAAGSNSVQFFYQYGTCLLELAGMVVVKDLATQAVGMFTSAVTSLDMGNTDDSGGSAGAAIGKPDLAEAEAHAWLEIDRIDTFINDDDDDDDDDDNGGGGAATEPSDDDGEALEKALEAHRRGLDLIDAADLPAKCKKQVSFSKQLQRCAEDFKDFPAKATKSLELAVAEAKAAVALVPADRPAKQQYGACLITLGKIAEDEAEQGKHFRAAVTELRAGTCNLLRINVSSM
jgi:hypothetical protein